MWKAQILSINSDPNAFLAQVEIKYFKGNEEMIVMERVSEPESIKKIITDGVVELNRVDRIKNLILNPTLGEVDVTVPEPTPEVIEEKQYQENRQKLIVMKQDLDLGLITQDTYNEFLATIK